MSKLWGGRFTKQTDALVETYTASIMFDKALYEEDIQGSLAHVTMLGKQGVLPADDVAKIQDGLRAVLAKLRAGEVEFAAAT
jgi:argininosuccinate lyase